MERHLCSWMRRLNIVKMSILLKSSIDSMLSSSKSQWDFFFFAEIEKKKNPKIQMEPPKAQNNQNNREEQS